MKSRNLTPDEIYVLEQQGCYAENWNSIIVKDPFIADFVWHTSFAGNIIIGSFSIGTNNDANRQMGIYHSTIINCDIGDDVLIEHVKHLENYEIESSCILQDIGNLSVHGKPSFGNGTALETLNEAGGRLLKIYDKISAQVAWLMVMCRHDKAVTDQLEKLIDVYVESKRSVKGVIGKGAVIRHCQNIHDVNVGEHAKLKGVQVLIDGTILSSENASTFIRDGVTSRHFIIQEGSEISEDAILDKCLIGQAVKVGKQYSAENSVFFSNSECFHGEACSVFGGPYTVTHHKSSLLIAGQYSFFNAGSGTNQSNHMYKLGPMHQGIVERGCKTGSFSYMLWPTRLGAYSVVMGKHTNSFDSGDFPFSYITEEHGKTLLTPAMNLFTVGTKRDIQKWPARDKRKAELKYDNIIFDLYAPYIIQKVIRAIDLLNSTYENTPKEQDLILLNGLNIHRLMLKTGRKYYELALQVFFGEGILLLLSKINDNNPIDGLRNFSSTPGSLYHEDWLDLFGLFMPISQLDQLLIEVKRGAIKSIEQVQDFFSLQFNSYESHKTNYFINALYERKGIKLNEITAEQLEGIILDWKKALTKLNNMILKDAEKEFDATSHIGYGISSNAVMRDADFENVHGKFEDNGFVMGLNKEIQMVEQKANEIISKLT